MNAADAVLGPSLARGLADAPALIAGARVLTYGAVQRTTDQCARGLRALGIGREHRVLIALKDSPEFVSVYLGAMKVGAVAVPVDPRAPADDLLFYLQDSRAKAAVLDASVLPVYGRIAGDLPEPPIVIARGGADSPTGRRALGRGANTGRRTPAERSREAQTAQPRGANARRRALAPGANDTARVALDSFYARPPEPLDAVPLSPDDMAFWIYTSGTTGAAKASVHVQHDVIPSDAYLRETLGVTQGMRLFATSKLFFAYALGTCLFGSFRLGATTILHGEWPAPEGVRDILAAHRPDIVFSVPAFYRNVLRAGLAAEGPFRGVRTWVSAGEKLPEPVYRRWKDAAGAEIVEGIGASETIYMFLTNRPGDTEPGSAGYPAPGAQVRLVDGEGHAIGAPGRQGVLQVRMDSVCDRYWNRQELTREALHGPWFSTGDLFTRSARGRWTHRGRQADLIDIAGRRVNPAEIEECVLALPQVADAAAIGVADGDGRMRLVLYAVPGAPAGNARAASPCSPAARRPSPVERGWTRSGRGSASPLSTGEGTAAERREVRRRSAALRRAIAGRLSAYGGLEEIRFVQELPRTASGKVQRYRLRQELARETGNGVGSVVE